MLFSMVRVLRSLPARALVAAAAVALVLSCGQAACAQEPLQVKVPPKPVKVKAGKTVTIPLQVLVSKGWHVFGPEPLVKGVQGAQMLFAPGKGVAVKAALPAPRRMVLAALKAEGNVYEGTLPVPVAVSVDKAATPGRRVVNGTFQYQACSDSQCMFPKKVSFRIPIEVVK